MGCGWVVVAVAAGCACGWMAAARAAVSVTGEGGGVLGDSRSGEGNTHNGAVAAAVARAARAPR